MRSCDKPFQLMEERLQKILARAGVASRRAAEDLIEQGEVTINGKVAKLGDKAKWGEDAIKVRGKLLQTMKAEPPVYLAFHKPRGVLATLADTEGRPTLADYLKSVKTRVFPVGRLDFNSEGLIILTNDGNFAEKLQKHDDIPRFFHVKVKGHPTQADLDNLKKGAKIPIPGHIDRTRMVRPHTVRVATQLENKSLIEVVMIGSAAADLRTLFEFKGFLVERTIRYGIGQISIRGVLPGAYKLLSASQVEALFDQPELGLEELSQRIEEDQKREADGRSWVKSEGGLIEPVAAGSRPPRSSTRAPRASRPDRATRSRESFGEKKFGERTFRDRPYGKRSFDGDRPERPRRGFDERADRTQRRNTDRPERSSSERTFGEMRGFGEKRPRPARGFGRDREDGDRAPRGFGPRAPKSGGASGFGEKRGGWEDRSGSSPRAPRSPRTERGSRGPSREGRSSDRAVFRPFSAEDTTPPGRGGKRKIIKRD